MHMPLTQAEVSLNRDCPARFDSYSCLAQILVVANSDRVGARIRAAYSHRSRQRRAPPSTWSEHANPAAGRWLLLGSFTRRTRTRQGPGDLTMLSEHSALAR